MRIVDLSEFGPICMHCSLPATMSVQMHEGQANSPILSFCNSCRVSLSKLLGNDLIEKMLAATNRMMAALDAELDKQ